MLGILMVLFFCRVTEGSLDSNSKDILYQACSVWLVMMAVTSPGSGIPKTRFGMSATERLGVAAGNVSANEMVTSFAASFHVDL